MVFAHKALNLIKEKPLIYTAMSKHYFYYKEHISKFVIENGGVPMNPFMIYNYFLLDTVDRDDVREGNNNLVMRCDELWVFGPISNGVLAEVKLAKSKNIPVKYYGIRKPHKIVKIAKDKVEFEEDVADFREEI